MMAIENKMGMLGEKELEEAAKKEFQEEPEVMERSFLVMIRCHGPLVYCFEISFDACK